MLNYIREQSRNISRLALILIWLVLFISTGGWNHALAYTQQNFSDKTDMLAYTVKTVGPNTALKLYDPRTDTSKLIHVDSDDIDFSFSANGRLAYSSNSGDTSQIYVVDTLSPNSSPINISQDRTAKNSPLAWSRDGRYLAFISESHDKKILLNVWDGNTTVNITPSDLVDTDEYDELSWSVNDRLAFTVRFADGQGQSDPSEIYLWNGKKTTSFSQNPTGDDEGPTWNTDGRIAFLSKRDSKYGIYVWDGVSFKNGGANVDSFLHVAANLTGYFSRPTWTSNGLVAFSAFDSQDSQAQIYLWNGQTSTNISQNPTQDNFGSTWSNDGRWAFNTPDWGEHFLYVRDAHNKPLLTVNGDSPAWSSSGYLAFCNRYRSSPIYWAISMWDGQHIVDIVRSEYDIRAQWQSGSSSYCSDG